MCGMNDPRGASLEHPPPSIGFDPSALMAFGGGAGAAAFGIFGSDRAKLDWPELARLVDEYFAHIDDPFLDRRPAAPSQRD